MNQDKLERIRKRRSIFLLLGAYLLGLATNILGIVWANAAHHHTARILFWVCSILPLILGGLSVILRTSYGRKLEKKSVADMQQFLISHRQQAQETAAKKLRLLNSLCNLNAIYGLLFAVLAFGSGFFGQILTGAVTTWNILLTFWSGFLYLCALDRIHIPAPAAAVTADPLLASREEYPQLYEIAEACGRSQGWQGKIAIRFTDNCNAGIHRSGDTCSIYLGVLMLNLMTREELQAVFCHEFNHIFQENRTVDRVRRHYEWLSGGFTPHFLSPLVDMIYTYPDTVYTMEFNLYRYASSIDMESAADQAMVTGASAEAAASMLMKLKFHDLFLWEEGTYDVVNDYAAETPDEGFLDAQLKLLKERMVLREPVWRELFFKEILARNATHPTAAMRLEALGVPELPPLRFPEQEDFLAEARKAMAFASEVICRELKEHYAEARQEAYLAPLELVQRWEEASQPVIAEEYGDVDGALRMLGRYQQANALCKKAMETLPEAAACHGAFLWGVHLLRCYDDTGVQILYDAIERNHNYMDEGLSVLGEYFCLTGNQEGLDTYRQRAVDLAQEDRDVYSQMNDLKKGDHMEPEKLPEELHNRLLEYLERVDQGYLDRVYLVRKVIDPENFTSAVVVRFRQDAPEEARGQVMDKIFHFLDTCADWQFSLFIYESVYKAQPEKVENSCIYIHEDNENA